MNTHTKEVSRIQVTKLKYLSCITGKTRRDRLSNDDVRNGEKLIN